LAVLLTPLLSAAGIWYITPDSMGDASTIQAGIDSAQTGDTVLVAAGTYTWATQGGSDVCCGPTMITLKSGVTLLSESGAAATIIDAEGAGRVMICMFVTDVVIDGFWIRGGNAVDDAPISIPKGSGGGILCGEASIVIRNNIISHNWANYLGGGIELDHAGPQPPPLIANNVIHSNFAGVRGGAIEFHASTNTTVRNNTIISNTGGGIGVVGDEGIIENNIIAGTIANNQLGDGALYCASASPIVRCNDLWSNEGGDSICGVDGGGNFTADPLFCVNEPIVGGNFRIRADSPCAPGSQPGGVECGLIGSSPADCGGVPVKRTTWGAFKNRYPTR